MTEPVLAWLLDEGIVCPHCAARALGYLALLRRSPQASGDPPEPLHEVSPTARCAECRANLDVHAGDGRHGHAPCT